MISRVTDDATHAADPGASVYDPIARFFDLWSRSVVEDVPFYVEEAERSGGPVVELGIGTGRIAVPIAAAGIRVIGIDSSRGMLEVCAEHAALAGVDLDLRLGDFREPPVDEAVPLVICPFRSLLHMQTDDDRRCVLREVRRLLQPGGKFIFDIFAPSQEDITETHGRWIEREPQIFERADWDESTGDLTLSVRGPEGEATMHLAWLDSSRWQALLDAERFAVEACYGWFDRSPYFGGEDTIWVTSPA
jgi:SAM-dependent methyltransferase